MHDKGHIGSGVGLWSVATITDRLLAKVKVMSQPGPCASLEVLRAEGEGEDEAVLRDARVCGKILMCRDCWDPGGAAVASSPYEAHNWCPGQAENGLECVLAWWKEEGKSRRIFRRRPAILLRPSSTHQRKRNVVTWNTRDSYHLHALVPQRPFGSGLCIPVSFKSLYRLQITRSCRARYTFQIFLPDSHSAPAHSTGYRRRLSYRARCLSTLR